MQLKILLKKLNFKIMIILMFFYQKIFGIKKNYAVFKSFNGKQYSDNPRAISEKLHELDPNYQIVWLLNKNVDDKYNIIPDYVKIVHKNRLDWLREISKCSVYVTNTELLPNIYKNKKKQFFIQTWHGDRGFKKILYEANNEDVRPFPIADNQLTNLCIAGSDVGAEKYKTAFHFSGKVLVEGCPRNDKLIHRDYENEDKLRKLFHLEEKKVLLYAPTFRDDNINKFSINIQKTLEILEKKSKKDWGCLVRFHPGKSIPFDHSSPNVINVTDYPDIADLLTISDMLITDYSSCCGDFILCNKPIILCQFDKDSYIKNCRKFRLTPEECGYFIAYNQKELEDIIMKNSANDFKQNCKDISKKLGVHESGDASLKVCSAIIEWQNSH